ncbi:MAG TPA: hypothetical protein VFN82_04490 [Solirubrobacterales bacterium]|jgi:hypothetical protein|nr:hypothetical protein [Solirubrobacterales bacterium]
MDLKRLANRAKKTIDRRGGVDSLKADAEELRKIAKGDGSLTDKAKRAAKAVKEPGAGKDIPTKEDTDADPGGTPRPGPRP